VDVERDGEDSKKLSLTYTWETVADDFAKKDVVDISELESL